LPAIRELAFFNMLAAVAVPRYCDEMIENVDVVLTGTGIPVIELDKETFTDRVLEAIEENEVNLALVMTFPYKIPSSVYKLPAKGFYNIHPGPLPQYRGHDPVFQQLKNKEWHKEIEQELNKINTEQIKKELDVIKDKGKIDQQLAEWDKQIKSGQLQGQALEQLKTQRDKLSQLSGDPAKLSQQSTQFLEGLRKQQQDANNQATARMWKTGIRTSLASLLLAAGYGFIGFTGLRGRK